MSNQTKEKLNQLVALENADFGKDGITKISENEIIEKAIHHYHSHLLGKDVLSDSVNQLQEILSNTIELSLKSTVDQFANAINHLNMNDEVIKRGLSLLMLAAGTLPVKDEEKSKIICEQKNDVERILEEAIYENMKNR